MTILEILVKLRDDIRVWCINNFKFIHSRIDNLENTSSNLEPSRALVSDSSGKITISDIYSDELSKLGGITINIQEELDKLNLKAGGYLGKNPVNEDTTTAWISLGTGHVYIDTNDTIVTRPSHNDTNSPYGIIESQVSNTFITQKWHTLNSTNRVYVRAGNSKGWYSSDWMELVTSKDLNTKQDTITGAASEITDSNLPSNKVIVSTSSGKVSASDVSVDNLNYLSGVTSDIQLQLNNKANQSTTYTKKQVDDLISTLNAEGTADAALVQNALNAHKEDTNNPHNTTLSQLGVTATATELNRLKGIASSVQTQLDSRMKKLSLTWTDVAEDTTDNWKNLGSGWVYVSTSDGVTLPQHNGTDETVGGVIINYVYNSLIKQEWHALTKKDRVYVRGGNSSGWYNEGVWNELAQANDKQDTIIGAASTVVSSNLSASKVLVSTNSGKIAAGPCTATEVSYLSGVTSKVQTQLDNKASKSHTHTEEDLSISGWTFEMPTQLSTVVNSAYLRTPWLHARQDISSLRNNTLIQHVWYGPCAVQVLVIEDYIAGTREYKIFNPSYATISTESMA